MKNFKKILLTTLPILFIFLTINIVQADTFNSYYLDPTLKSPSGCGITGGGIDDISDSNNDTIPCTDNGYREIQGTLNLSSIWNYTSKIISLNLSVSYQVCKDYFCIDGNNSSVYGGNSYLNLSSDLVNRTVLSVPNIPKDFTEYSCVSNCFSPSLKSFDSFSWSIKLAPDFLPLAGDYTLNNTFIPSLITPENTFTLTSTHASSTIPITNPCGITEQQVIDNYYNNNSYDYIYKIYSPWKTYREYYNNFNTVEVVGISEMLYGDAVPSSPGADTGTLRGGGTMCVEDGNIPNGYLYDFGDCTPSIPEICPLSSVKTTIKLR